MLCYDIFFQKMLCYDIIYHIICDKIKVVGVLQVKNEFLIFFRLKLYMYGTFFKYMSDEFFFYAVCTEVET